MTRHAGHELRVYRLAALLCGDPRAAAAVTAAVIDSQPRLDELDPTHLDRMTVLRTREIRFTPAADSSAPTEALAALATLPDQQREAWVLADVLKLPWREVSRAMDCSNTATARHLQHADAEMRDALGDKTDDAARLLRQYAQSLSIPRSYRARRQQRVARRVLMALLLLALLVGAVAAVAVWWPLWP